MSLFARFRRPQPLLTSALLVAVLLRALIPAGFMPSSGRPFTLQICPSGLPASVLASLHAGLSGPARHSGVADANTDAVAGAHHDAGTPGHDAGVRAPHDTHRNHEIDRHQGASALEECSFGAASAGAALIGQWAQFAPPSLDRDPGIADSPSQVPFETRRFRQHQPRAPPVFS
jgi:hypothetical protein